MANTLAQGQLTPMQLGGTAFKVPSLASLGKSFGDLTGATTPGKTAPSQTNSPFTGMYIDPTTGQLMIPGAQRVIPGAPAGAAGAPSAYDWNNDQTAVGSSAWRRLNDPDFYRPDGGGR